MIFFDKFKGLNMNNSSIVLITNDTMVSKESITNMIPIMLITGLLMSVPVYCCIVCFIRIINKYIYDYGEYTENSINESNIQLKFRSVYENLFGSISSPKLTKIIVVTICSYEANNSISNTS